jgi:hypothetical protein
MAGEMIMQDYECLDDLGQPVPATVIVLQNNLIKALHKAYPTWKDNWHIVIDTRGGIVQIRNTALSGKMGFVMHITKIDSEMRKVVRAAGELFERYNVARKKGGDIRQALADLKRDPRGHFIYED